MARCRAEIDLNRIKDNTRRIKEFVGSTDVMAIVKADGYGLGAVEVSRAAIRGGATSLGVAIIEEGIELRRADINVPILVLSEPEASSLVVDTMLYYELTPTVYTKKFIDYFPPYAPMHLMVDTGMRRAGVDPLHAVDLALYIKGKGHLLEGLMTHFAVADQSENSFTRTQMAVLNSINREIQYYGMNPIVHAANSSAVFNFPESHYDMVRCGLGIYDGALGLKSVISSVRHVSAGTGVSYGLRISVEDTNLGTIPLGYADGVPWRLSGRGEVFVGNKLCRILSVTMDQTIIDLGKDAVEDDEVVLLGRGITVSDWARWVETIPYEIMCGIQKRVPKYYKEGGQWKLKKTGMNT